MPCPDTSPGQAQCLHEFELTWARVLIDLQARAIVDLNRRLRGQSVELRIPPADVVDVGEQLVDLDHRRRPAG